MLSSWRKESSCLLGFERVARRLAQQEVLNLRSPLSPSLYNIIGHLWINYSGLI